MTGLTYDDLNFREEDTKQLLDIPAQEFLTNEIVLIVTRKIYNLVFDQIDINEDNKIIVKDAIEAISAWQCFGIYGQSVSSKLQLQDISAFKTNSENYKEMAQLYAARIQINLNPKAESPLDDSLPYIEVGGSSFWL